MLRETWANVTLFRNITFRVVFLLGVSPATDGRSSQQQHDIEQEFVKYGDIVQGNFIDTYKNLSLKALVGLRWVSEFCPEAEYVLKADDDAFVNIFELIPLMNAHANKSNVIICSRWGENLMPILRDRKTCMKWCVQSDEFKGRDFYPSYCAGIGYVVSRPLVPLLYNASKYTPFFWVDDVYVTGMLTKNIPVNITYVDVSTNFTMAFSEAFKQYNSTQPVTYLFVHTPFISDSFLMLWKFLMKRQTDSQKNLLKSDAFGR
jgi:hypothetical protein